MKPQPGRRRWAAFVAATSLTALVLLTAGCEAVGYYAQSIGGHLAYSLDPPQRPSNLDIHGRGSSQPKMQPAIIDR